MYFTSRNYYSAQWLYSVHYGVLDPTAQGVGTHASRPRWATNSSQQSGRPLTSPRPSPATGTPAHRLQKKQCRPRARLSVRTELCDASDRRLWVWHAVAAVATFLKFVWWIATNGHAQSVLAPGRPRATLGPPIELVSPFIGFRSSASHTRTPRARDVIPHSHRRPRSVTARYQRPVDGLGSPAIPTDPGRPPKPPRPYPARPPPHRVNPCQPTRSDR